MLSIVIFYQKIRVGEGVRQNGRFGAPPLRDILIMRNA